VRKPGESLVVERALRLLGLSSEREFDGFEEKARVETGGEKCAGTFLT